MDAGHKTPCITNFFRFQRENAVPAGSGTAFFDRLRLNRRLRRWSCLLNAEFPAVFTIFHIACVSDAVIY